VIAVLIIVARSRWARKFRRRIDGGALGSKEASPLTIMGIWFGITAMFLFFWMIGLLAEIQRSETIDLQRLMHLPIALGQVFASITSRRILH